jgi:hypothetical protein
MAWEAAERKKKAKLCAARLWFPLAERNGARVPDRDTRSRQGQFGKDVGNDIRQPIIFLRRV